jgi:hypothetical protein
MYNGLDPEGALAVIKHETDAEFEEGRHAVLLQPDWEDRGAIGFEKVEVLVDRMSHLHSMTDYPCRMPDGRMGKVSMREIDDEWVAICVLA